MTILNRFSTDDTLHVIIAFCYTKIVTLSYFRMNNQAIDFNYNLNIDQATEIIGSYYKGYFSSIACRKHIID